MKNTYMKSFIVACVATIASIGSQTNTAEAITENRVVETGSIQDLVKEDKTIQDKEKDTNVSQEVVQTVPQDPEVENKVESKTTIDPETTVPVSEPETVTQEEPVKSPSISISAEEKDLFARLVEAEAKGESYEGKVAVATVVLNRVESTEFPDTVTGVIKEVVGDAYAFSPVQNGEINKPASDESIQAVEEALTREDRLNNSIYFYNPEIATDEWIRTREEVATIGNHVFAK